MSGLLVTGATGVLGRRLVRVLQDAGVQVFGTARSEGPGVVAADLSRPEDCARVLEAVQPEVVVHLAGGPGGGPDVFAANVLPTVNLLQAAASVAPGARFLVTGSAAEYGEGTGAPLGEDATCAPVNDYGRAKLAQTSLARTLARTNGLEVVVVRPFNVVAWDMPSASPLGNLRRQVLEGRGPVRSVLCGRVDVLRDFVAADDVAQVLADLARRWPSDPVLNLCSGQGVRLEEVAASFALRLGVELELRQEPDLVALPAADVVVGDPARLRAAGHGLDGSVENVAAALAGAVA